MPVVRACIECDMPAINGTRCAAHQKATDRAKAAQPHRRINQRRRTLGSATEHAKQNRSLCSICGNHTQPTAAKRDVWHWHHLTPGDPHSPQAPAHEHCNTSLGNRSVSVWLG